MEGAPEPAPEPGRRRRVLLVFIVAAVVVAAGFVVYWEFIRPRTIAEVFAFDHFQPGSAVTVAGTITRIYRQNTSYGPKVVLQLDSNTECNVTGLGFGDVFGDPNATYSIGQVFQTTLHFQRYTIDGNPAVTAPELACPFPEGFTTLRGLLDAVSSLAGILLVYNGSAPGGWQDYRILTRNGDAFNLSVLPVTLEKTDTIVGSTSRFPPGSALDSAASWDVLLTMLTYGAAGGGPSLFFPLVDRMSSLRDGTSANGSLRFIDANADRMLDDGDRLDIRLPPTTAPTDWDTYLLQVGVPFGLNSTYTASEHILLNGPQGPLEALLSSERPQFELAYAGTQVGPPTSSTVQVNAVPIGPALPLSTVRFSLNVQTGATGNAQLFGNVTSLPETTSTGVTLSFTDTNGDNLLDIGDRFTVTGAANQSTLNLIFYSPDGGAGSISWIVGFGPILDGIGNLKFTAQGSGPWTIRTDAPSWSPELAFNRTLQVTLLENGEAVLTNVSLVNGTLGTFANGSLGFTDADRDGYLSTGDYFTLSGKVTNVYALEVTAFFGVDRFASPLIL